MIVLVQAAVIAGVLAFSLRRALLLVAAFAPRRALPPSAEFPAVTVLVAARNEAAIASRLLTALERLEYPAEKVSFVLVCDGCTDRTAVTFRRWADARSDAYVVILPAHQGKAAALNAGLARSKSEVVVVVDADMQVRPDFLRQLVSAFRDQHVGAAAALLWPSNSDENIVSRYAAVTSWVHQLVTSAGKDRLALNPPTLGAAAYRRSVLEKAGGFPLVAVGVDVAASDLVIREGFETRFVAAAVVENTVVSSVGHYWRQHLRWARGVLGAWPRRRPAFRRTVPQRIESWAAAVGYGDRLVFLVAAAGAALAVVPLWVPVVYLAVPGTEILLALLKGGVRRGIPRFVFASMLFFVADIAASLVAVVVHLAGRPYRWESPRRLPLGPDSTADA